MTFKKHIPNIITCCNLIAGCFACISALTGYLDNAFYLIMAGAIFDFFDGMAARLLKVSSPIGKELDSLADVVTFGVAPSMMLFYTLSVIEKPNGFYPIMGYTPHLAFVMAAFSALRLAKFNLDTRQTTSFIGLPTPANALFWGALIVGKDIDLNTSPNTFFLLLALLAFACWILVAEIPMFALKFKQWGWKGNEVRYSFILSCIPILAFFQLFGLAIIIAWYIVLSVVLHLRHQSQ
ncbi:MAG: CDP-diacylglycerol--serine O-phosphatidyltransferase [Prevotella sp.]|nr:CDP-diacylglycerol--serine O-phosphatidyltransferase [Prevotella sp.]